jgi:copper resistance protein B
MTPAPIASAQGIGLQQLLEMMDWGRGSLILVDKAEYVPAAEGRPIELDAVGWYGGDYDRLWFRAEGEQLTADLVDEGELHAYYGRLVTPYWDALAGLRLDGRWGEQGGTRAHLALGVIGLAPLRFELAPAIFLSQAGDFFRPFRG